MPRTLEPQAAKHAESDRSARNDALFPVLDGFPVTVQP